MFVRGFPLATALLCCALPVAVRCDYIKGASYFAQGKYELAIQEYEEELRLDPAYVQGYYIVGICYARLKNYDKAIESLKKAQTLDQKDFQISLALAQAYFDAQKYPELKDALNNASLNAQTSAELEKLRFLRAAALFNQQDYAQALPELEAAVRSSPRNASLEAQLGVTEFHLKKYDEAIKALTAAVTLNPEDAQATLFLGEAYFAKAAAQTSTRERTKGFNDVSRLTEKWVAKQPRSFEWLSLAGRAALALKNYSRAVSFLRRAAEVQPDSPTTQFDLGQAYAFAGQFAEAETALIKASQTLTQQPALFSTLGFVLEKQNKLEAAEAAYRQASTLAPSKDLETAIDRVRQKQSHPTP